MCLSDCEEFVDFSIAVVLRAANDYRKAVKYMYVHRNDEHKAKKYYQYRYLKKDAKDFFLSEDMYFYFELDGVTILRKLNRELDEWKRDYKKKEELKIA